MAGICICEDLANNALSRMEAAGILKRLNERKWGRAWEAGELLDLVAGFEERVNTVLRPV